MKRHSNGLPANRFPARIFAVRTVGFFCFAVLIVLQLAIGEATAATITPIGTFDDTNGGQPVGNLVLVGSNLYGVAAVGGPNNDGVVYSIPVGGGAPTILGSFNGSNGSQPEGNLVVVGSTLYGMTRNGGANSLGTVFSIPLSGGSPTAVFSFNNMDGATPFGNSLILSGSTLYGVTRNGGSSGDGVVFSLPVGGSTPTVISSLSYATTYPQGGLTLVGSTLYGTSTQGNGLGTVFSVPVSGGTPTVLASFNGNNGYQPLAGVIAVGSTLYGTTGYGGIGWGTGSGYGTVFSVPIGGGAITTLAEFNGTNGYEPEADMTLIGSTLYGTTGNGGANGQGSIFSVALTGGAFTDIASFTNVPASNSTGAVPVSGLTLDGSTLYGATVEGGPDDDGVVYALAGLAVPEPSSWLLAIVGGIGVMLVVRGHRQFVVGRRVRFLDPSETI